MAKQEWVTCVFKITPCIQLVEMESTDNSEFTTTLWKLLTPKRCLLLQHDTCQPYPTTLRACEQALADCRVWLQMEGPRRKRLRVKWMRGEIHFLPTFSLPHPRLESQFTGYDIAVSIGDSFQYAVKKPSLALHEQESVSEFEQGVLSWIIETICKVELLSFDSPYNLYISIILKNYY